MGSTSWCRGKHSRMDLLGMEGKFVLSNWCTRHYLRPIPLSPLKKTRQQRFIYLFISSNTSDQSLTYLLFSGWERWWMELPKGSRRRLDSKWSFQSIVPWNMFLERGRKKEKHTTALCQCIFLCTKIMVNGGKDARIYSLIEEKKNTESPCGSVLFMY